MDHSIFSTSGNMNNKHKNPSKEACQNIIRRILTTEELQNGKNIHFKSAIDFMNYFESLYMASPSLSKQVQRALKDMNMPKDKDGYLMVNKTVEQFRQEVRIATLFQDENVIVNPMEEVETVFITASSHIKDYLTHLICNSDTFSKLIVTVLPTYNGLLIYTTNKEELLHELKRMGEIEL